MAVNLSLLAGAGWQFFDDNGDPLSGGKINTYAAGTTTPLATYTSSSGATPNANPIILNAAGRLSGSGEIWLSNVLYKFVVTDANNVLIGTYDNISGVADASALSNTSDPTKGDALVGFRQSNSSGNLPGSVGRTVHQKLQEIVSLKDFGAVGDGIADDTAAVQNAVSSGAALDWGNFIYRITSPLIAEVIKVDWTGSTATILYDGSHVREAVRITCGVGVDHRVTGMVFDANEKANVAAKFVAATVGQPINQWPNFYASQIVARNAYRASTAFPDGDGFRVDGGFNHAEIDNIRVHDCYMAANAAVSGVEGIFGVTFASNGARRCRNIRLSDYHIENVWSQDPLYEFDQDGVRIFQETAERTSSCFVLNGTVKNVSNRAIKLHSAVNAVVDGLYRELNASVIPQSGAFGNPDIDSQQCPSTITNCRFHYDGAWHNEFIRNYTERTEGFRYGGATVSDITARIVNAAGNDISAVILSAESGVVATKHLGTISNISVDGPIARFLSIVVRGTSGSNSASLTNAIGEITSAAVRATNDAARLRVTASNLHNTNSAAPVPLGEGFTTADRLLFVSGFYGFTSVGAEFAIGGGESASNVGPYLLSTSVATDAAVTDTDVVLLLPPLNDVNLTVFGTVNLYRGSATTAGGVTLDLFVRKQASTGDAAGHCQAHGAASTAFSLITCTYAGVQRIAVRMTATGVGTVLSEAFFTGRYFGSASMRLVPASAVTGIAAFVQRSGFAPASEFLQPLRLPIYTVAALPTAATFSRTRAFVSDANSTTFASIVAGGGANLVPVYSDGTSWRIG